MHTAKNRRRATEAGFSLMELIISMGITLVVMAAASTLIAQVFSVRSREDRRADAIADLQRAMNSMSREIASSGVGLPDDLEYTPPAGTKTAVPANGLLLGFSNDEAITFVSNLNVFEGSNNVVEEDEALRYALVTDADGSSYLVRQDLNTGDSDPVANRIDALDIRYIDRNPTTGALTTLAAGASPTANTVALTITVTVTLPAVGSPNSSGYQPPWQTQLVSNVSLRNAILSAY